MAIIIIASIFALWVWWTHRESLKPEVQERQKIRARQQELLSAKQHEISGEAFLGCGTLFVIAAILSVLFTPVAGVIFLIGYGIFGGKKTNL